MNGEASNGEKEAAVDENVESAETFEDTIVMEDVADVDNVGDISVELNVEELVAKIEAGDDADLDHKKEVHRRLEKLNDQREVEKDLEDTYNFNLDEDL